jgi:hypothetical protein
MTSGMWPRVFGVTLFNFLLNISSTRIYGVTSEKTLLVVKSNLFFNDVYLAIIINLKLIFRSLIDVPSLWLSAIVEKNVAYVKGIETYKARR